MTVAFSVTAWRPQQFNSMRNKAAADADSDMSFMEAGDNFENRGETYREITHQIASTSYKLLPCVLVPHINFLTSHEYEKRRKCEHATIASRTSTSRQRARCMRTVPGTSFDKKAK